VCARRVKNATLSRLPGLRACQRKASVTSERSISESTTESTTGDLEGSSWLGWCERAV
jgi:hypothetical protein